MVSHLHSPLFVTTPVGAKYQIQASRVQNMSRFTMFRNDLGTMNEFQKPIESKHLACHQKIIQTLVLSPNLSVIVANAKTFYTFKNLHFNKDVDVLSGGRPGLLYNFLEHNRFSTSLLFVKNVNCSKFSSDTSCPSSGWCLEEPPPRTPSIKVIRLL